MSPDEERETAPEPSVYGTVGDCPQWLCPHVSVHDRREGKVCTTCAPCNCEPSDTTPLESKPEAFKQTAENLNAPEPSVEYVRKGVCLLCGGAVLNSGEHLEVERHEAEVRRITEPSDTDEREAACVTVLESAAVGSVMVDPFDAAGDAPVVGCKNRWGLWALLGEKDPDRVWNSRDCAEASQGRAMIVYEPERRHEQITNELRRSNRDRKDYS